MKDYEPVKESISLHGLGFLQVKLPCNKRLHVWHPDLPRREFWDRSAIHNHRFSFRSTVLIGTHYNQRCDLILHPEGTHDVVSHDGPRSEKGGRLSFNAASCNVKMRNREVYQPGESYVMPELEYHHTPNEGIVVTLMEKLTEGEIHACSVVQKPYTFDQSFDRFQLSPYELWKIVTEALKEGGKA